MTTRPGSGPSALLSRLVHGDRWRRLVTGGLDLLFPSTCIACGQLGHALCPACAQTVVPVPLPCCPRCGRPQPLAQLCHRCTSQPDPLQMVRAAALYCDPLRTAIHRLKYRHDLALAEPLARYLVAAVRTEEWSAILPTLDGMVPVPLHTQRLQERGYNQSALLATALSRRLGLPVYTDWLVRSRPTTPQVGLSAQERRQNVADAFTAAPAVEGKTLLVVDDVYTTGATLAACGAAALQAGARVVYGLTLAVPAVDLTVLPDGAAVPPTGPVQ